MGKIPQMGPECLEPHKNPWKVELPEDADLYDLNSKQTGKARALGATFCTSEVHEAWVSILALQNQIDLP